MVKPYINSSAQSDHIIIGQNLSLNCSVSMDIGIAFTLRWKIPDEQKLKVCFLRNKCINNTRKIFYIIVFNENLFLF